MGNILHLPVDFKNQESLEKEATKIIKSYDILLKKIVKDNEYTRLIEWKHKYIQQHWNIIFPLLHKKDFFYKQYFKIHIEFIGILNQNTNPLEVRLLV